MNKRGISSSNEDDNNNQSNMNDIDQDQENKLNLVQRCNGGKRVGDNTD